MLPGTWRVAATLGLCLALAGCICEQESTQGWKVAEATVLRLGPSTSRGRDSSHVQVYYRFLTGDGRGVVDSFSTHRPPSSGTKFEVWYDPKEPRNHVSAHTPGTSSALACVLGLGTFAMLALGGGYLIAKRRSPPKPASSA